MVVDMPAGNLAAFPLGAEAAHGSRPHAVQRKVDQTQSAVQDIRQATP